MQEYQKAFKALNPSQRRAVETIDGPVLVIAGPGTGKTQLLALRVAQILRKDTTMLPSNILCLTFTDNAADNMRQRLVKFIGQDAYHVAIHTFNSFGSYVMNAYPEYFYEWRELQTADELTSHRLLEETLGELPGDHALAKRGTDGTFFALRQIKNLINDTKKNNLSPNELKSLIAENQQTYTQLGPIIRQWPSAMSGEAVMTNIENFASAINTLKPAKTTIEGLQPIKNMIIDSFKLAAAESGELSGRAKTKPFTAWKNNWLEKDDKDEWIFKDLASIERLQAAADIYDKYQQSLEAHGLADFNDQIMWVLRSLKDHDELRYNLQERFQYLMIDEFQDTNRAQLQLGRAITDAPVHEGRPNILVVGDDDQAVFRFQGADIGNIELFETSYKDPEQVTLSQNYRSTQQILSASRAVSSQIVLSLEKQKQITKELVTNISAKGTGVVLNEFDSQSQHYASIAKQIKKLLGSGVKGHEIAALGRERRQLDELVEYLRAEAIPIDYERSENVLEQEHIVALLDLARLVMYLGEQRLSEANALLPQILSEPMWQLEALDIWKVATRAYREKRFWLDVIFEQKNTKLRQVADFLLEMGNRSASLPAEQILDKLIGTGSAGADSEMEDDAERDAGASDGFISPFKGYFFAQELLAGRPGQYLTLLSHLNTLRRQLGKYQTNQSRALTIRDLIEFVDSYRRTESLRMLDRSPHREDDNAVKLMTVHKAKGLEFDNVFVVGLQNGVWTKTGRSNRFSYPDNLKVIKPADNDADDSLRLLFVAMTRARHSLSLNYYIKNEEGKSEQAYGPLLALRLQPTKPSSQASTAVLAQQFEQRWLKKHSGVSGRDMKTYLSQELSRFQLSATGLFNFIDVSMGGPLYFLTQNLLHFPASKGPHAIYGTIMHTQLRTAHETIIQGRKLNIGKITRQFLANLTKEPLDKKDLEYFSKKGQEALRFYLTHEAPNMTIDQRVETDFKDYGVVLGNARLKGLVDRMDFDPETKTIAVSDYKTGAVTNQWQPAGTSQESERIKMYRYRQQLLFYKLLVEHSSEWGRRGWKVEKGLVRYVEPSGRSPRVLELSFDPAELASFKSLIKAVWAKIQELDFPNTQKYPPSLAGIKQFEMDLIDDAEGS